MSATTIAGPLLALLPLPPLAESHTATAQEQQLAQQTAEFRGSASHISWRLGELVAHVTQKIDMLLHATCVI